MKSSDKGESKMLENKQITITEKEYLTFRYFAFLYDYSSITALGKINANGFDGSIACNDPNLNFLLQGAFALSPKTNNARYRFFTNIGHADLHAINLDKRGVS